MGYKILMLSKYDFAGTGFRLAEAISRNTKHMVIPICTHPYDLPKGIERLPSLYKTDKELGVKGWFGDAERMQTLVNNADIIHFKGDSVPISHFVNNVHIPEDKPRIVTVGGSYFRRGDNKVSQPIADIEEYIRRTDFRSCLTPDLNYPEYKGEWIPHAYDCSNFKNEWKNSDKIIVGHSPSDGDKKGTEKIIKACEKLGDKVELRLLQKMTHPEVIEAKKECTIFIDEISETGWYGMAAVEAMAMGIPTMAYLSKEAIEWSGLTEIPVINCGKTPEQLANTFQRVIKGNLKKISEESFEYAKKTYSYEAIGKLWGNIYENL